MAHNTNGSKWIRPDKRLAIYLRDGLACVYCGRSVEGEDPAVLTLDHIIPSSKGGTHEATNLVTACLSCNSRRGNRSLWEFAVAVSIFIGTDDPTALTKKVWTLAALPIGDLRKQAKAIIAARKVVDLPAEQD